MTLEQQPEPVLLDDFLQDAVAAVGTRELYDDVEALQEDLATGWEQADTDQQRQMRQFWQHYKPHKVCNMRDFQQFKKICKVMFNFAAIAAPEYLIDPADGKPINI